MFFCVQLLNIMSLNIQTLTGLARQERDKTGRIVNIYRKKTIVLTKEQAQEYRMIEEKSRAEEEKHPFKKWEGPAMFPIYK